MLLDWELGDTTGLEVARGLRGGESGTSAYPWLAGMRIIIVSGDELEEGRQAELRMLGVVDYWTKPVTALQLRGLMSADNAP